jgi:hypothetical protein
MRAIDNLRDNTCKFTSRVGRFALLFHGKLERQLPPLLIQELISLKMNYRSFSIAFIAVEIRQPFQEVVWVPPLSGRL